MRAVARVMRVKLEFEWRWMWEEITNGDLRTVISSANGLAEGLDNSGPGGGMISESDDGFCSFSSAGTVDGFGRHSCSPH